MTTRKSVLAAGVAALMLAGGLHSWQARAEDYPTLPAPAADVAPGSGLQTAVLSGGCFWGVQGVFEHVKGVRQVWAGYAGGKKETAQYETVSTGTTGHAESVQITFDPHQTSYGHLLQIFFSVAMDPTQKDAQGPDNGTQYRSEIWVADADQRRVAQAYIAQLDQAHVYDKPIVTRVDPVSGFFAAEGYHQDFLVNHPDYPYISAIDMPKVEALKAKFPMDYIEQARTTKAGT